MKTRFIFHIVLLIHTWTLIGQEKQLNLDSILSTYKSEPIFISKVDFIHNDSTFKYYLYYDYLNNCFGPKYYFYESADLDTTPNYMFINTTGKKKAQLDPFRVEYFFNQTMPIIVKSNFSTFRTPLMPYKNTYDDDWTWTNYIFELEYSFVQQNLNELPFDTTLSSKKIRITDFENHSVYRVNIYPSFLQIIYKKANIDSLGQPRTFLCDTCIVEKKFFLKYINKELDKIDFDKVDYFAENGLNQMDPCLFEIQKGKDLLIVRRNTTGGGEYSGLYLLITAARNRYKMK